MAYLELQRISKRYGEAAVMDDVTLEVERGELLVLAGPSGCGKSTLLRIVAGLASATSGELWLDGERIDARSPSERDVAMVFQSYALYPHMSVRQNLAFPLRLRAMPRSEIESRVVETASVLGLGELLDRKPSELSGGQMQRVALGRAIVRRPRLFLFDEPLSNLDAQLRTRMRGEIARLQRELGVTTLYVTHDQSEAMTLGSRIAVLQSGRVLQVGEPLEVFERPATDFVATFIGSPPMSLVAGTVHAGRFEGGGFSVPLPWVEEGAVRVGLRPQDVALRRGPPGAAEAGWAELAARVTFVEALGTQTLVECDLGGARLLASAEGTHTWSEGESVWARFALSALHAFDSAGRRLQRKER